MNPEPFIAAFIIVGSSVGIVIAWGFYEQSKQNREHQKFLRNMARIERERAAQKKLQHVSPAVTLLSKIHETEPKEADHVRWN